MLHPDRFFDPNPAVRSIARALYHKVNRLPLICPHGHVDPRILAEDSPFPDPAALLIIPDHYIFRMLRSQGIPLEDLGIPRRDGGPVEQDPRKIWRTFAENFRLFRGTPTSLWLNHTLLDLFGVDEPLDGRSADRIYDRIAQRLADPAFRPRALFQRFNIEVLCTTDAASDPLPWHQKIRASGWKGDVRPTFRPDKAVDLLHPEWRAEIGRLSEVSRREIGSLRAFLSVLEERRAFFRSLGATATDHAVVVPAAFEIPAGEAEPLFQRALAGKAGEEDAARFSAHMLMEMARMSVEDGLVMQLHPGSLRNHDPALFERFGPDKGFDIPVATEYTRNLRPLLNRFGNDPRFRLILFTLDESAYSRELAPLAGAYPSVLLGPPWWFHDSLEGMNRFRLRVTETAGIYNTAGFNDDTRAFPSIPARHDLARRADANFLARLTALHVISGAQAEEMIVDLAVHLPRRAYRFAGG